MQNVDQQLYSLDQAKLGHLYSLLSLSNTNQYHPKQDSFPNSNKNFYEITFKNIGGLVTPLIIEWTYEDNSTEIEKIPAEIWRFNEKEVTKVFTKDKVVKNIRLDPNKETADVNVNDNSYPRVEIKSDFDRFNN